MRLDVVGVTNNRAEPKQVRHIDFRCARVYILGPDVIGNFPYSLAPSRYLEGSHETSAISIASRR